MLDRQPRLLLLFVLLSNFTVGLYAWHFGYSILAWDDSEFVEQALETSDHLMAQGLLSWPAYIASGQHYSKPTLYINTLAGMIQLVGRDRVPLAIGLLAALTSAALGLVVFLLMRQIASPRYAILSMIAVAGLPGWSRWASSAYADLELVVCALWTILLLQRTPRARWLGLALGLGMLAKITFPALIAVPLFYWLSRPRTLVLLRALLIAALIAGLWYGPNLQLATGYAGSSYVNQDRPGVNFLETTLLWLRVIAREGLSWALLLAGAAALLLYLIHRRREQWPAFPRYPVALLLWGALPVMLISVGAPSATSRYWLASFVMLALALLISIYWIARADRLRDPIFGVLVIAVGLQWILTLSMQIPWTFDILRASRAATALAWIVPGFHELEPMSFDAVNLVMDRAEKFGRDAPRHWYLSGNNTYLNVPRLQLAAKIRNLPVQFDWADYFSWPESKTVEQIRTIAREPAILLIAEPLYRDEGSAFLVRRAALVKSKLGDFRLLEANAEMAIYATPQAFQPLQSKVPPPEMNFAGILEILDGAISGRTLTLRAKLDQPMACSYMMFIHAALDAQPIRVWDQKPDPLFCHWSSGEERTLKFTLPDQYSRENDRIEIGFFDEADAAHNWPPLKLNSGGNSICFAPAKNKTDVPVRPCRATG
jgi:hypothetical protein